MRKEIIIGLVVIVLIGIGVWIAGTRVPALKPIVPTPGLRPAVKKNVIAAVGNSEKEDTIEAFTEALNEIKQKLGKAKANLVLVYSNVKYDNETGLKMVKEQLGTDKIFGSSGSFVNMDSEGYYGKGGVTILALSSDYIRAEIGRAVIKEGEVPQEMAKKLMGDTIKGEIPDVVLVAPTCAGFEEEILEGFGQVIGREVPILGATAGDNSLTGKWVAFAGTEVIPGGFNAGGVAIAAIYTDLKFGYAYTPGFEATEKSGIITKMEGDRIIKEIDGRPAQEVYNEWMGISYEEWTDVISHQNPLGSKCTDARGRERLVVICPFPKIGPDPERNIAIFHDFEEGKRIWLLKGNWETFLSRARTIPEDALVEGDISSKEETAFGVYFSCIGANLTIPEEHRPKQQAYIKEGLAGAPFIGVFGIGQQGHISGVGNVYTNLSPVILVFSQELK